MSDKVLGFAVSNGGNSWRRAWSDEPLNTDETWSETQPTPTADFVAKQAAKEARKTAAMGNAKAVTNWKAWSESQAQTWYNTNIGTPLSTDIPASVTLTNIRPILVSMLTVMREMGAMLWALARIVIAMRDEIWPDMPESNGNALK